MERRRGTKVLIIISFLIVIVAGLLIFNSKCRLENVNIKCGSYYSAEEIEKLLFTDKTDDYTLLFYLKYKLKGIQSIPFVEKIDIELTNLNTVDIYVYDKIVTGCVKLMGRYMHFDREGIVVESSDTRMSGCPEINGLEFSKIIMNEKLEIQKDGLFDTILNLTMLINKNALSIDEIDFDKDYAVTLYSDGTVIQLGRRSTYDVQLNNLSGILAGAGEARYSLDMRNYDENNRNITAKLIE